MRKKLILITSFATGVIIGASVIGNAINGELVNRQNSENRYFVNMILLKKWLLRQQIEKGLEGYFIHNNYHEIAIYGMGHLGECLLNELRNSNIKVKYAIDKNANNILSEIDIKKSGDYLPAVDAVIVTPVYYYADIKKELEKVIRCPIISLEEVIYFQIQ